MITPLSVLQVGCGGSAGAARVVCQIPGCAMGLDQIVCDGKTLRGSIVQTDVAAWRSISQVTSTQGPGVALPRPHRHR